MSKHPGSRAAGIAPLGAFVTVILIAVLASSGALAQIEEITVTARKTEESLQDVPISIAAFSSEQMRERGIKNNYDVAAFTPNFTTSKRVGRALDRPTIRGMANPGTRGEPNASYFIDGMFVAGSISTATTQSMERVEVLRGPQSAQFGRATFSGAVNYVTRKPTDEWESNINARYGTHEDRMLGGWISGPIFKESLLLLVSASYENYGGQWNNNLEPNSVSSNCIGIPDPDPLQNVFGDQNCEGDWTDLGEEQTTDFLTKLTWLPFESTEVNLKYSYSKGDDGHYPNNYFDTLNCFIPDDPSQPWFNTSPGEYCGEFKIAGTTNRKNLPDIRNGLMVNPLNPLPPNEAVAVPADIGQHRDTHRVYGDWSQDIGDWQSVLKGSYSRDDFDAAYDLDHREVRAVWGLFAFETQDRIEDYSVEYAVSTPIDRAVRAKLGVYYYDQDKTFRQRSFTGPFAVFGSSPGADWVDPRLTTVTNSSVFGGISFDLADAWTLDFEARYAKDEKKLQSGQRAEIGGEPAPVRDSLEFTAFTPRITLNWRVADDMLVYGLVAKGNKPGGFNEEYFRSDVPSEYSDFIVNCDLGDVGIGPAFPPGTVCTPELKSKATFSEEEQWTYEVGIKSQWFDRRLTANLSVFFIDWANQGLFELDEVPQRGVAGTTPITILDNAGQSKITGFELESNWLATDNLSLFFNYGYNDGEYVTGISPNLAATTGGDGDISGNTVPDSPKHSAVFGFDASAQAGRSTDAFLRADFLFETKRYNGSSNFNYTGERKIVNMRTGLRGEAWTLTLYVRNLLNDDTPLTAFDFVNFATDPTGNTRMYAMNPQLERDVGVEFTYSFSP